MRHLEVHASLHVGYALAKLDADEAEKTLALFREAGLAVPEAAE